MIQFRLSSSNSNITFSGGEKPKFNKGKADYSTIYNGGTSINKEKIKFIYNTKSFDYHKNTYTVSFGATSDNNPNPTLGQNKSPELKYKGFGELGSKMENSISINPPNKID